jgi:hypothetical protein
MGDKPVTQTLAGRAQTGKKRRGAPGGREDLGQQLRPKDTEAGRFKISKIRERKGLPKLARDQTDAEKRAARTASEQKQQAAAISGSPTGQEEQRNRGKLRTPRSLLGGK